MTYQDQISSLSLISDHLIENIQEATKSLESYHNQMGGREAIKVCLIKIHQINRVFSFLELAGAQQLTKEILRAFRQLPEEFSTHDIKLLESISFGMTLLTQYINYIENKPFDLPQLLLVPINDLRTAMNQPLFAESTLFEANHQKIRKNWEKDKTLDDYDRVKLSRRLRQMYQIGLIETLRQTNVNGGLVMMNRALGRLDAKCGSPNSPNLWWVAQGAIHGFIQGGLLLSPVRIKLFTRIDQQIRTLGHIDHNLNYKNREEAEKLTFELLYLVSLSDAPDDTTKALKAHFSLKSSGITERTLSHEFLLLKGLSENDYANLYSTITNDVELLQAELITNDYEAKSSELHSLLLHLKQLYSLFTILEFIDEEIALESASLRVNQCIEKELALSDRDRKFISDTLSKIEPKLKDSDNLGDTKRSTLSREKLSASQMEACIEARKFFQLVIKQLEHYADASHNPEILESVPATLSRAYSALEKVESDSFLQLIADLSLVFQNYFTKQPATIQGLEMLADILCSIEFHLETKQQNHKPSEKIYQFASENLAKLKAYLKL